MIHSRMGFLGASHFLEIVCQTLEEVSRICMEQGRPMPEHLIIQVDNTVSQAKNETTALFLAWLVVTKKYKTVNLFFLMVGHTHEDIDQLFAVIMFILLQKGHFQTPEEMLEHLEPELQARMQGKFERLVCSHLHAVRDFDVWLAALGRRVYNCFGNRFGIEAPHSFTYKLRSNLTRKDHDQGMPETGGPGDCYCCTKTYMRSIQLQDVPLRVLGPEHVARLPSTFPTMGVPRHALSVKRVKELRKVAQHCTQLGLDRASARLITYVMPGHHDPIAMVWLPRHTVMLKHDDGASSGCKFFDHLPVVSFSMKVRDARRKQIKSRTAGAAHLEPSWESGQHAELVDDGS